MTSIYLLGVSGLSVNFHYCSESIEDINLGGQDEANCCCKGEAEPECCNDKTIDIATVDVNHQTSKVMSLPGAIKKANALIYSHHNPTVAVLLKSHTQIQGRLPGIRLLPAFVRNTVMRI